MRRFACVHGHFYQPPRENPWTGAVERQPSAGRDHDWNARIARECYLPNGEARVVDGEGRLSDIVDNYAWMSFNFGPTLLAWIEKAEPALYARLLEADKESVRRLDGHGNALAQAFHHSILPLASPRDRMTEIRWGLADFRARFGREAEGMWLPECAADDATLADVAAEGVKFIILEPHQAEAVRPISGGAWKNAAEALRPGTAYRWSGGKRTLAIFFYDGPLSRSIAFERAMSDSRALADRVALRLPADAEESLALFATDGESYGHHESFAEMGLAHFLRYALPEKSIETVNLGWWLGKHAPREEVRLLKGATSWSCPHGVERWRSACGCGAEGEASLSWRAPLRSALEGLRDRLDALYVKEAAALLPDPWIARDAYISVALDRSEGNVDRFLAVHAPAAKDAPACLRARILLEMQRHALMMFTSCGWFFGALSRLEPVQILLYAARALELARTLGADYEDEFVAALEDETGVWPRLVKPLITTPDHVAADYAVFRLFEDEPLTRARPHRVESARFMRRAGKDAAVVAGRATFSDGCTGARWTRTFRAAQIKRQCVQIFVCADELSDERYEELLSFSGGGISSVLPPGRAFLLRDLGFDAREKALRLALKRRLVCWEAAEREEGENKLALAQEFCDLSLPLPSGLEEEARLAFAYALAEEARRFSAGAFEALAEIKLLGSRARASGLTGASAHAEEAFARGVSGLISRIETGSEDAAAKLVEAIEAAAAADLSHWRPSAQTRIFQWLKKPESNSLSARRLGDLLAIRMRNDF